MFQILGILGGILGVVSFIPYIRDTLLLKTKPHRATFFIWSVLGAIAFFSQLAKGATNSLWFPGLETFGVLTTFIISIKYGLGGFDKRDYMALLVAAAGVIIWYLTKEAAFALYIVIFVDAVGLSLTIRKAYLSPESETDLAWIISSIGGVLAAISVDSLNIIILSYPIYIAIANLSVVVARRMGIRRKIKI